MKTNTVKQFLDYVEEQGGFGRLDDGNPVYDAMKQMWGLFPTSMYMGTEENHRELDRARSYLLTNFINAASVQNDELVRDEMQETLNSIIKQLIWFHVIDGPRLSNIQVGQRRVVRELYEGLKPIALQAHGVNDNDSKKIKDPQLARRLPYNLSVFIRASLANPGDTYDHDKAILRGVVDFIASLSDDDAYYHHSVLTGSSTHASL